MERIQNNSNRAVQFSAFDALDGISKIALPKKKTDQKKELSEYEEGLISDILSEIVKGDEAEVVYYDHEAYVSISGRVISNDTIFRVLKINGKNINFEDIISVKIIKPIE